MPVISYDTSIVLMNAIQDNIDFDGTRDSLTFLYGQSDLSTAAGKNQTILVDGTRNLPATPTASAPPACAIIDHAAGLNIEAEFTTNLNIFGWSYDPHGHVTLLKNQIADESHYKIGPAWGTRVTIFDTGPHVPSIHNPNGGSVQPITETFLYASHVTLVAGH